MPKQDTTRIDWTRELTPDQRANIAKAIFAAKYGSPDVNTQLVMVLEEILETTTGVTYRGDWIDYGDEQGEVR